LWEGPWSTTSTTSTLFNVAETQAASGDEDFFIRFWFAFETVDVVVLEEVKQEICWALFAAVMGVFGLVQCMWRLCFIEKRTTTKKPVFVWLTEAVGTEPPPRKSFYGGNFHSENTSTGRGRRAFKLTTSTFALPASEHGMTSGAIPEKKAMWRDVRSRVSSVTQDLSSEAQIQPYEEEL
jgi:hypothetical protein